MKKILEESLKIDYKVETNSAKDSDTYTINLNYDVLEDGKKFKGHSTIKFEISYKESPPRVFLTLIEAQPQRMGVGKLLVNIFAKIISDMHLKKISVAMNNPDEHNFYVSVGFKAQKEDIEKMKNDPSYSELSEDQRKSIFEARSKSISKKGDPEEVVSKTEDKFKIYSEKTQSLVNSVIKSMTKSYNEAKPLVLEYSNYLEKN